MNYPFQEWLGVMHYTPNQFPHQVCARGHEMSDILVWQFHIGVGIMTDGFVQCRYILNTHNAVMSTEKSFSGIKTALCLLTLSIKWPMIKMKRHNFSYTTISYYQFVRFESFTQTRTKGDHRYSCSFLNSNGSRIWVDSVLASCKAFFPSFEKMHCNRFW